MKTYIWYSTFATALVTTRLGNVYEIDFPCHELEWLRNWAKEAIDEDGIEIPSDMISKITFIDSNTGELLLECEAAVSGPTATSDWADLDPWDEEGVDPDDWDDDCDYEVGYDPYLGCFTWDE